MHRQSEPNEGDPSFDALVLAQVGTIRRIGARLLHDRQELEDFIQEVLLRVYANRERLRDVQRLPQWVHGIARNTARNWNRKARPVLMEILPDEPDTQPSALERMEREEHWTELIEAMNALSPKDRDILFAHYFEDAGYGELEASHGLTYRAVAIRLTRARQLLRLRLDNAAHGFWLFLFPPRKARGFGELPTRMNTMRPATLLTALFALAGATGASWYLAAQTFEIPLFVDEPLPRIELVASVEETPKKAESPAGGGATVAESPLIAQAPAAPFRALQAGTWVRKADLLTPRYGLAAVAYKHKLYAVGGGAIGAAKDRVEEYDPITEKWTIYANNAWFGWEGGLLAQIDDRVYEVENMLEYNLTTKQVSQKTRNPESLANFACGVANGKIYAMGGNSAKKGDDGNWIVTIHPSVQEYNPVTDTWVKKNDMPIGKAQGIAVSAGGKIYVFWWNAGVDEYDPVADSWQARTNLPDPFIAIPEVSHAVTVNGRIYLILLSAREGFPPIGVLEYDPSTDVWTKTEGLPQFPRRYAGGVATLNGKIYLVGGLDLKNGGEGEPIGPLEVYDPGLSDLPVNPQGKLPTTLGELKTN